MPASANQRCGDDEERHLRRLATYRRYRRTYVISALQVFFWTYALVDIRMTVVAKAESAWRDCGPRRLKHSGRGIGRRSDVIESGMASAARCESAR
jgi:hypothetical protein